MDATGCHQSSPSLPAALLLALALILPAALYAGRVDVRDFGAKGDGEADDAPAIQRALDQALRDAPLEVDIPAGAYRIGRTLRVHSRTTIRAAKEARLFTCDRTPHARGDYLLTNANHDGEPDRDIAISGGIWDGNARRGTNFKPDDIFLANGWSGVTLNFRNLRNLTLQGMELANSVTYNIRLCHLRNFRIRDIRFTARETGWNQDGLHFNGYCFDGAVDNIRADTFGQTNDDLLAFNADDSMRRIENFGMVTGPISNIVCRNISADNCHSAVRLLSVDSPITDITISNLVAGCRVYAVNADAARYCRTPLFKDPDKPQGVGLLRNIHLIDSTLWTTAKRHEPLVALESNTHSLTFTRIRRDTARDIDPTRPFLQMRKTKPATLTLGSQTIHHPLQKSTILKETPPHLAITAPDTP